MYVTFVGLLTAIGYLLSKLVDIYVTSANTDKYEGGKNSLTFSSNVKYNLVISTILMALISLYAAAKCFSNFGKGLPEALDEGTELHHIR
jgi:hypothetical protein